MRETNERGLDLNLLLTLEVLLQADSVTGAAARLGLSQPAMSHRLRRLRAQFGDPLVVPGRGGLTPTPRAQQLAGRLRAALDELGALVQQPDSFDPTTARRTFHVCSNDLGELCVIPLVLARLSRIGPQLSLIMHAPGPRVFEALERGDLDLVFGGALPEVAGIVQRKVAEDDWQCLARIGHPQLHEPLTLQRWADLSHVLVGPDGAGPGVVDEALATRGLTRRIAYRTPYFVGAPQIIARSDLILTIPGSLARNMMHQLPLQMFAPPIPLPRGRIYMVFHERMKADAGHQWLRELSATCTREGIEAPAVAPERVGRPTQRKK